MTGSQSLSKCGGFLALFVTLMAHFGANGAILSAMSDESNASSVSKAVLQSKATMRRGSPRDNTFNATQHQHQHLMGAARRGVAAMRRNSRSGQELAQKEASKDDDTQTKNATSLLAAGVPLSLTTHVNDGVLHWKFPGGPLALLGVSISMALLILAMHMRSYFGWGGSTQVIQASSGKPTEDDGSGREASKPGTDMKRQKSWKERRTERQAPPSGATGSPASPDDATEKQSKISFAADDNAEQAEDGDGDGEAKKGGYKAKRDASSAGGEMASSKSWKDRRSQRKQDQKEQQDSAYNPCPQRAASKNALMQKMREQEDAYDTSDTAQKEREDAAATVLQARFRGHAARKAAETPVVPDQADEAGGVNTSISRNSKYQRKKSAKSDTADK